jgi:hypothetical protein
MNKIMFNTVVENEVRQYVRVQLENMIYILGLEVSACIDRDWAVSIIKEEVKKI